MGAAGYWTSWRITILRLARGARLSDLSNNVFTPTKVGYIALGVMKVTLDHNCIIDALNGTAVGLKVRAVAADPSYSCHVVDIGASEMRQRGVRPDRYDLFEELLRGASLHHLPRLAPMGIWDITFWDKCVWASDEMANLAERIDAILFPSTPKPKLAAPDLDRSDGAKLVNRTCDVQSIWAHIHYGNDIFCTSDGNFHKATRLRPLLKLGARAIKQPAEL